MTDIQSGVLERLKFVLARYDVRSVPEALIMMLTTDAERTWSGWDKVYDDQRLELLDWVAENVSVDQALCLFIELGRRGPAFIAPDLSIFDLNAND